MGQNLPPRAPKPKEKQENTLEKEIQRTAAARDDVTYKLLGQLLPQGKDPRKFIEDACNAGGITPPQAGETLAFSVYLLQRDVLKFKHIDKFFGCDGKCGHRTLDATFLEFPQLKKAYSKELRSEYFKDKRKSFAKKHDFPVPPSSPTSNVEKRLIHHQAAILLGDSLFGQVGKDFYRGSGKYRQLNKRTFHGGKTAVRMQRRYAKILHRYNAPAYVEWLGTNDLSYKKRKAETIYRAKEKIVMQILKQNPNARIISLALLPVMKSKYHPNPERARRIVAYVNRRMKALAARYPNNITFIDLHSQYLYALQKKARVFAGDKLHLSVGATKAIKRMLQDELEHGRHSHLINYL